VDLISVWFALIVMCWTLFLVLEGFDFGVGMLGPLLGRDDHERGAVLRTVGPFWDGNEVWLVAAIGLTFAAFPGWYAAMLSGLYLPMVVLLLLLAGRGVALEFRGKHDGAAWRRRCDAAVAGCSAGVVMILGAVLSVFARGLALGADGEVTATPGTSGLLAGLDRSLRPVLGWPAAAGAGVALFAALLLGSTFLGLRTTGPVRRRARRLAVRLGGFGAGAAGAAGLVVIVAPGHDDRAVLTAVIAAVICALVATAARAGREALAFAGAVLAVALAVVAVFGWHLGGSGSVVLPSTLNPAWSLTLAGAAATDSALRLISLAGVLILPGVLAYQAFSYWVFRRRVASERVAA
jgi:cytochrome d ubiquinol oxidase subunit II